MSFSLTDMITSPWLSHGLAIAGILVGLWLYVLSKRRKILAYKIQSNVLISDVQKSIRNVQVLFDGKQVYQLTSTNVFIWNEGNDTLNGADFAKAEPLRIVTGKTEILDVKITCVVNPANDPSISWEKGDAEILLHFDYFDHSDGIVTEILHTGGSEADISVRGEIKGAQKPIKASDIYGFWRRVISIFSSLCIIGFICSGPLLAISWVLSFFDIYPDYLPPHPNPVLMGIFLVSVVVAGPLLNLSDKVVTDVPKSMKEMHNIIG